MKDIISNIDTNELPKMYYRMKEDLTSWFNSNKDQNGNIKNPETVLQGYSKSNKNLPDVYFKKYYEIDLWGWSGLSKWYNKLMQRKSTNKDLKLFKNIYLDPTLCLRRIQDNQYEELVGDAFWNRKIQLDKKNLMKCALYVVKDQGEYSGKYQQQELLITITFSKNLNEMLITLQHQFTHFLDHLTSLVIDSNVKKLKNYIDVNSVQCNKCNGSGKIDGKECQKCRGTGFIMDQHTYTPNNGHYKDTRVFDKQQTEYQSFFSQIANHVKNIIDDCIYFSNHYYYGNPQILLYFSYLLQKNLKNKKQITKQQIKDKILQQRDLFDQVKLHSIIDWMEFLIDLKQHKNLFNDFQEIKTNDIFTYNHTIRRIYSKFKDYFKDTELSEKILN